MNKIKAFYAKNRLLIIIGLGFILLMQVCSQGGKVNRSQAISDKVEQVQDQVEDTDIKPLQDIYERNTEDRKHGNPEMNTLFILMGLVLLVYVATKRGWMQKIVPPVVWISIRIKRHKQSKERIASLSIINKTKESITFSSPVIGFGSWFKKSRQFRLKGGVGEGVFPLTLAPGTSHSLNINLDVFRNKAEGLQSFKWVYFSIDANNKKKHTSIWKYLF